MFAKICVKTLIVAAALGLPLSLAHAQEGTEARPSCRMYFTQSWDDINAPLGSYPTSGFYQKLKTIFADAGAELIAEPFVPWTRAVEEVMRGKGQGLSMALETPSRAEKLAFLGPIFTNKWYKYIRRGANPNMASPTVGVLRTYADLTPIIEAVEAMNGTLIGMPYERLGRMLEEDRVDVILASEYGISLLLDRRQQQLERLPGEGVDVHTYVAIKHDAPCMTRKAELNAALSTWAKTDDAKTYSVGPPNAQNLTIMKKQADGTTP
ncbi:MAG: hypothetical protein JJ850_02385 [Kordiimonadaceae bacterium]|nr:hypothetical protein [Kordiimonadaceae bacterium]MBO6567347.1 hypothetical protein [Kordiimonadaceae bacterium]MBO6963439.1 hypothetical protein [Kordiimonadaceae bacterium]